MFVYLFSNFSMCVVHQNLEFWKMLHPKSSTKHCFFEGLSKLYIFSWPLCSFVHLVEYENHFMVCPPYRLSARSVISSCLHGGCAGATSVEAIDSSSVGTPSSSFFAGFVISWTQSGMKSLNPYLFDFGWWCIFWTMWNCLGESFGAKVT
jgi:hypothetical protein